jgi:hypothetical protein
MLGIRSAIAALSVDYAAWLDGDDLEPVLDPGPLERVRALVDEMEAPFDRKTLG